MATQVLTQKDFNWLELLKVRVQNLASAPGAPQPGWAYFDTTLGKLRICTNAVGPVWVNADGSDIPDSTITSAKIADLTIVNGDISASAGIVLSKLAVDPLARAGHTGTQAPASILFAATARILGRATAGGGPGEELTGAQIKTIAAIVPGDVTGFDTQVRTNRLDQMAVPTADIPMAGFSFTGLREPANPQDPATKNYVDLARQGIRLKDAVKAATTGPITLSGTQTIDGVAVVALDRVLVKDQAAPATNGIYIVNAGAWTRATDADTAAELADGATVFVQQGSAPNANTTWAQISTIVTLGTDAQSWTQQGAATAYTGGNGIDVTGLVVSIKGPGNGILADGTSTRVDPVVVARKYNTTVGDGAALFYVKTHGLGNQWVTAQVVRNTAPYDQVDCDIELTDTNNVTVRFTVAPTAAQYRLVVVG